MPRNFITITQKDIDTKMAEQIRSRELELMSYDFERQSHEEAITALGDITWDDKTLEYRGLKRDTMIIRALAAGLDSDAIQRISDLLALDSHKLNLEAVITETSKSERHYDSLLNALPEGEQRDDALAATAPKIEEPAPTEGA